MTAILKAIIVKLGSMLLQYIPHVGFNLLIDVADEIVLSLLEKQLAKSPSKQNLRRIALYRKYWEGFKGFQNRKNIDNKWGF